MRPCLLLLDGANDEMRKKETRERTQVKIYRSGPAAQSATGSGS